MNCTPKVLCLTFGVQFNFDTASFRLYSSKFAFFLNSVSIIRNRPIRNRLYKKNNKRFGSLCDQCLAKGSTIASDRLKWCGLFCQMQMQHT